MSKKKGKRIVLARDVGMEETYPGEAEETANERFDDPYIFEAYESIKDQLKKERQKRKPEKK